MLKKIKELYNIIQDMEYLKKIKEQYNMQDIIILSIIISSMFYLFQYFNILKLIEKTILIKVFIILIILVIVIEITKYKPWKLFSLKTVTLFDFMSLCLIFSSIESLILNYLFFREKSSFIPLILSLLFVSCLLIFIIRMLYIQKIYKKHIKNKKLKRLVDLYKNNKIKNSTILLTDEPIKNKKEDLFNLKTFIEGIKENLTLYNSTNTLVIALIGKWGSGKSSVINLLKEQLNEKKDTVIEVLKLWKYENQMSLFEGFFDFIFKIIGENFNYYSNKKNIEKYKKIIFGTLESKFNITFSDLFNDENKKIEIIKKQINDIIKYSNKKIIVVIDDIDRLDVEEVKFIFKIIKNIFDFENLIYILCYDETQIKKVFEKELNIDKNYLDKFISNKIYLPEIQQTRINEIGEISIKNLLKSNKILIINMERYKKIVNLIFCQIKNLRETISFLNYLSFSICILKILKLNVEDFIAIQFIKFKYQNLYDEIYRNCQYYISNNQYNSKLFYEYEYEYEYDKLYEYNLSSEEYFNKTFINIEKNYLLYDLIGELFPNVKMWLKKIEKSQYKNISKIQKENEIEEKYIDNVKYFDSYFIINFTQYVKTSRKVDTIISIVNGEVEGNMKLTKMIKKLSKSEKRIFYEILLTKIKKIKNKNLLFQYILNDIAKNEIGNNLICLATPTSERKILSEIIKQETNIKAQKKYIKKICNKNVSLLGYVLSEFKNSKKQIFNYGKMLEHKKINNMMDNKQNIFYMNNNRRYFLLFFSEDKKKFKEYITPLINSKTIYKFLGMLVRRYADAQHSPSYVYGFDKFAFDKLIKREIVDKYLRQNNSKLNIDQKVVVELYKNMDKELRYQFKINFNNL